MSYLVIARKYRPLNFEDVIGQEHVTTTLVNAINNNKVHHAYLLTGPRGVGKTTISRILAKALNCETGVTSKPCGVCNNCKEIDAGNSLDVKEIDGASNRGIDEIRDLRDDIKFAPASCRKKIYIIDEVHMLTNQAFNALLKTLEEPPEHAVFIFATTEANEVPATILSRCQRHDFRRVSTEVLSNALKNICEKENVKIDEESLLMITKAGDGSVRDSQSVLDQVIAFSGNEITSDLTYKALGLPALDLYFEFTDIVLSKNTGNMLSFIDRVYTKGLHILSFIKGLIEFYRDLLILKSSNDSRIVDMTGDNIKKMIKYVPEFGEKDILLFVDLLSSSVSKLKTSPFQRMDFEIILLKILHFSPVTDIKILLDKLSKIEGEQLINLDDIIKLKNSDSSTEVKAINDKVEQSEDEKKKTVDETKLVEVQKEEIKQFPEEKMTVTKIVHQDLTFDNIVSEWVNIVAALSKNRLNMIEYGVPTKLKDNRLWIKFDNKHELFKNFCDSKLNEIEEVINDFFKIKGLKVKNIKSHVEKSERLIKIKPSTKKSFEEQKNELLKESPELKFLFEDPLNCKFIDL